MRGPFRMLALLLAAAPAAAQDLDDRLAAADRLVEKAHARFESIAAVAEGRCEASVALDDIVEMPATPQFKPDGMVDLILHFSCLAVHAGDAKVCAALERLKSVPGAFDSVRLCRGNFHELMLARALAKPGPEIESHCREFDAANLDAEKLFKPGRAVEGCKAWARHAGDAEASCRETAPLEARPGGCLHLFQFLSGEPALCGAIADPVERERCEEMGALRRAARAGSAAPCGDFPACGAMMGRGRQSCGPYARRAARVFCGDARFRRDYMRFSLAAIEASEREAWLLLTDPSLQTLADAADFIAVDHRLEQIVRLRLRGRALKAP